MPALSSIKNIRCVGGSCIRRASFRPKRDDANSERALVMIRLPSKISGQSGPAEHIALAKSRIGPSASVKARGRMSDGTFLLARSFAGIVLANSELVLFSSLLNSSTAFLSYIQVNQLDKSDSPP